MTAETPGQPKRLESWKEIAAYLNRDVRTARRWEKDRGLPVRRLPGTRPGVYALVGEIDDWVKSGTSRPAASETPSQSAPASITVRPRWIPSMVAISALGIATALLIAIGPLHSRFVRRRGHAKIDAHKPAH